MGFKVRKTEDGKFGLYNTVKKEMSKKVFKSKEAAEKMASHYENFSQMRKKKPEPKTETKEEEDDEPAPKPKKKIVRKVKKEPKSEE